MQYQHTQVGWLHRIVYLAAVFMLAGAWFGREDPILVVILSCAAGLMVLAGSCFHYLRVQDEGDRLALRYGPLPVFSKRIRYADIAAVEPDRSSWIDGWGIHYIAGRGWTYNLWGFACAKITLANGRTIRVGSDDVENLVALLRAKTGLRVPP